MIMLFDRLRTALKASMALAFGLGLLVLAPVAAYANSPSQWVRDFWPTARDAGVSRSTYNAALRGFQPDPEVIEKSNNQAEFTQKIWHYMDRMVSEERLEKGARMLRQYDRLFDALENRFGVDRYVLTAIWGIESHYGAVLENPKLVKPTIRSLATLAYSGGRLSKFGRQQLVSALKIVQRGDVRSRDMFGSWAGAMGHTQFIPTTFEAYGVDFDGDGRRNIWTSVPDALGSSANYLKKSGWRTGHTWGYEVWVPNGVKGGKTQRSLSEWQRRGLRRVNGHAFPRPGESAWLYRPAGDSGPSFLMVKNFSVIKRYNNSNFYALAVGHLADRLRGGDTFVQDWPPHERPLTLDESKKLQILLARLGYYDGEIDGDIGSGSRAAIRQYQQAAGLNPDGVDTPSLLQRLERGE